MNYKPAEKGILVNNSDYSKRIIFSVDEFREKGHLLQTVTIPANTKQRQHVHKNQTEVYLVLEGETYIYINDKEYLAKPGDAFMTHPGDSHYLWNKSDHDFKLAVFKLNLPDNYDDTDWLE